MKKFFTILTVLFVFSASTTPTIADPISPFEGLPTTTYINGSAVDVDDVVSYTLSCGTAPGAYTTEFSVTVAFVNGGESVDVQACVTQPGTYYFAFTSFSPKYNKESAYSNEMSRLFTVDEIGLIPMAPVLISVGP